LARKMDLNAENLECEFKQFFKKELSHKLLEHEPRRLTARRNFIIDLIIGALVFLFFGGPFLFAVVYFFKKVPFAETLLGVTALVLLFYWIGKCEHIYRRHKKILEGKIKAECLPILLKVIGDDFNWASSAGIQYNIPEKASLYRAVGGISNIIPTEIINDSAIFRSFRYCVYDDTFSGTYNDMSVFVSEVILGNMLIDNQPCKTCKGASFCGLIISLEMNKNFKGHTVVMPEKSRPYQQNRDNKKDKLERIHLEDVVFEKYFDTYSTDQIEGRYILTTAFIERLNYIRKIFNTNDVRCSFRDNRVLIAIASKKDMFSLCELTKRTTNSKLWFKFVQQFRAVLSLVDILKLNQKIGL